MNMIETIARKIIQIRNWFNQLQIRQFLSIVAIGLIVLTSNVSPDVASKATIDKLDRLVHQENPERPKTTREWQKQAREVKGKPGERLERIGKQSADAIKEFGSTFPDVAKRSQAELDNSK
jgi:hypothetical protein